MPHPVNPDLGFKIEKAIIQMKETIRKRPTKPQQILQNSQPNFLAFLFKSVIPAFPFFSESIILQNGLFKFLSERKIFFITEKRVYVREGSWEPFEQLGLSKPLVFRRGIKSASCRWVHYERLCNNMGWNYQRNSSLVSFLCFFNGDGTKSSASDPHCAAKKLQFVSNTLFQQTGGHVGFPQLSQRYARRKAR